MQRGKHPWSVFVEGQTLDALALGLKFRLHHLSYELTPIF